MKISTYEIDFEQIIGEINKEKYKKILIQLPEGLKYHTETIQSEIQKNNDIELLFTADPCYGACDIPCYQSMKLMEIDAMIQVGHTEIPSMKTIYENIPIYFINALSTIPIDEIIEKSCDHLVGKNIRIVTTAQHLHTLKKVKEILKSKGYHPIISKGDKRICAEGQILGCNFSCAKTNADTIDSYLYIGSGMFHPLGLTLSTKKQVIIADPYSNNIKKDELADLKDEVLRQRYGAIAHAKTAKKFGILICTKPGQQRIQQAEHIKHILTKHNKKSIMLTMDAITPIYLQNYPNIDCFISTACPRIAIDDYRQYKTTILTPIELEITLGILPFEEYHFDEITPDEE